MQDRIFLCRLNEQTTLLYTFDKFWECGNNLQGCNSEWLQIHKVGCVILYSVRNNNWLCVHWKCQHWANKLLRRYICIHTFWSELKLVLFMQANVRWMQNKELKIANFQTAILLTALEWSFLLFFVVLYLVNLQQRRTKLCTGCLLQVKVCYVLMLTS